MGEYALYNGQKIKIGTCENMYYLRADQARLVQPLDGNVDPVKDAAEIRFRFPWPDEDGLAPGAGAFHDRNYERSAAFWSVKVPSEIEHGLVQFVASVGYNVCLPCPESPAAAELQKREGLRIHRNGVNGPVQLVQQKWWGEKLVAICRCGGCGHPYRLETLAMAQPLLEECETQATRAEMAGNGADSQRASWWREVARRILFGYTNPLQF